MAERYFVDVPIVANTVTLRGGEAHHLIHVMRNQPGAAVILFDGAGAEFPAHVSRIGRLEVELTVLGRHEINRESSVRLTLGTALPKGDRQRWLVEKAVELGVTTFVPLETRHGVVRPSNNTIQRLRRSVIEASKQCGRNRLMEIEESQPLVRYLALGIGDSGRWLAHPGGSPLPALLDELRLRDGAREIALAIGPEGGFSEDEIEQARAIGWQIVDLGRRLLRIETAAIYLASAASTVF